MGCRFRRDSPACGAPKKMIPISPRHGEVSAKAGSGSRGDGFWGLGKSGWKPLAVSRRKYLSGRAQLKANGCILTSRMGQKTNSGLVRGGKASVPPDFPISASLTAVRGWVSPTYGELKSTSSIVLDVCGQLPIRLITAVLFNGSTWIEQSEPDELRLKLGDASHILVTLSRLDSAASGNRIVSKIEVVSPPVNS